MFTLNWSGWEYDVLYPELVLDSAQGLETLHEMADISWLKPFGVG